MPTCGVVVGAPPDENCLKREELVGRNFGIESLGSGNDHLLPKPNVALPMLISFDEIPDDDLVVGATPKVFENPYGRLWRALWLSSFIELRAPIRGAASIPCQ